MQASHVAADAELHLSDARSLVDPELLARLDSRPVRDLNRRSLRAERARWIPMPVDEALRPVRVEERCIPGLPGAPDVPVLLYRPAHQEGAVGAIVHIHGGGFVMGSARHFEAASRALVMALGCAVVSIDYRLAPETVFPGALYDCYAALAWTFASAAEYGFDVRRIGVMGESAGGGLAAALTLLARDRGEFRLAFQHLLAPMIDDRTGVRRTTDPLTGQFIWTGANNRFGWACLLGHTPGVGGVSPYAAAARADDLRGLPPAYIHVGSLDLFVDEDVHYARRLLRAGVPVELHIWPGAHHGFDLAPDTEIARRALTASRDALRRALAG